jgi:hypothetical protein
MRQKSSEAQMVKVFRPTKSSGLDTLEVVQQSCIFFRWYGLKSDRQGID